MASWFSDYRKPEIERCKLDKNETPDGDPVADPIPKTLDQCMKAYIGLLEIGRECGTIAYPVELIPIYSWALHLHSRRSKPPLVFKYDHDHDNAIEILVHGDRLPSYIQDAYTKLSVSNPERKKEWTKRFKVPWAWDSKAPFLEDPTKWWFKPLAFEMIIDGISIIIYRPEFFNVHGHHTEGLSRQPVNFGELNRVPHAEKIPVSELPVKYHQKIKSMGIEEVPIANWLLLYLNYVDDMGQRRWKDMTWIARRYNILSRMSEISNVKEHVNECQIEIDMAFIGR